MRSMEKRWTAFILTIILMMPILPCTVKAEGTVYYIKNSYTQGAYLYEQDGILRYGIPTISDTSYQWKVEEKEGGSIITNVKSGGSITLDGHGTDAAEGNWGEPVACLPFEKGRDTFLWDVTAGEKQNVISLAKDYPGFAIHLEAVTNGQTRAQRLDGSQLSWGNMQWDFVTTADISVNAYFTDGFCIQSAEDGSFLRADNGVLTSGTPDGPDDTYIWMIEEVENGMKKIKNKSTETFLTLSNYEQDSATLTCETLDNSDDRFLWDVKITLQAPVLSGSKSYEGYGLYLAKVSAKKAKCEKIIDKDGYPTSEMMWNVLPSSYVAEVAGALILPEGVYHLKNSYCSMYMMEDDGTAVYGNADLADKNAQWRILYSAQEGKTAIRNEGTGHYLYLEENMEESHSMEEKNSTGELICSDKEVYYWDMKRNKNADYPGAVIFADSVNPDRYLHMESMNKQIENTNSVQPSWGTPHWLPIPFQDGETKEQTKSNIPTGFIRLQSAYREGKYLYENNAGALVYGECKGNDGRSHWEFVKSEEKDSYLIRNRESNHLLVNTGNGILRCVEEKDADIEGMDWAIENRNDDTITIRNDYSAMKVYQQPYVNIQKDAGTAEASLVSVEALTSQWIWEQAQEETVEVINEEEAKISLRTYRDTNVYEIFCEEQKLDGLYRVEYYGNSVYIINEKSQEYLFFQDEFKEGKLDKRENAFFQWKETEGKGAKVLENSKIKIKLIEAMQDCIYETESMYRSPDRQVFTVYVEHGGNYLVRIDKEGGKASVLMDINGILYSEVKVPAQKGQEVYLQTGINTIGFSKDADIKTITVCSSVNKSVKGASDAAVSYQAESQVTDATVLDEDRTYREIASEASGRRAVKIDRTGQSIKFTLEKPANAITIRYCIPDSEDGSGLESSLNLYVNGQKNNAIALTSKYSWVYGNYPWTNEPADGMPHHFFDEVSVILDETYPAGTVLKLQKDAANSADYYIIDFVETQEVELPGRKPENALSITDFGAVADDGKDDSEAVAKCITEATAQGKEVWIPAGDFRIDTPPSEYGLGDGTNKDRGIVLADDNVVIRGAGMWHSVLTGEFAAFFIKASNIAFYDFSLQGNAVARRDSIDPSAIETDYNTPKMENITIQNIGIEHYKTGIWIHNTEYLHVAGCKIRNTFADGINLRRGTSYAVVEQCIVRNTGDDAIAQWSSDYCDTGNKIRFNTVSLPWLANAIALYGGSDIEITDNVLMDTVFAGAAINISTDFKPEPFAGTILAAGNRIERCGSADHSNQSGSIWFNTVSGYDNEARVEIIDNIILESTFQGVSFSGKGTVADVILEGNYISGCGSYGIEIQQGAKGVLLLRNNVIKDSIVDKISNKAGDAFVITEENVERLEVSAGRKTTEKWKGILLVAIGGIVLTIVGIMVVIKKRKGLNAGPDL